jgi:hypothetical protein
MGWKDILKLTDEKNKQDFSSNNDYDYSVNNTKQELIHDIVDTEFAMASFRGKELPKPSHIKNILRNLKGKTISASGGSIPISPRDVDAYIAERPYLDAGGKKRKKIIDILRAGGSITEDSVEELTPESPKIPKPEPPKVDKKERLKKEVREKAKHRSNWELLSKDQQEESIQKTIDIIEGKNKKEIDEKSAPTPKDVKQDKATKLLKPNPKALPNHKLGRDFSGLDPAVLKRRSSGEFISKEGCNNSPLREPVPLYNDSSTGEIKFQGANNSWIVLGRDRPSNKASGYGGKCHTQAGSIDLVVGRMGASPREFDHKGDKLQVDNDFTVDSARIYISQKTDVDENFRLTSGKVGNAKTRSAIGIKADHIRIVAREGIKLVTRTDFINSQGGIIKTTSGIDLIAGNDDRDLQPLAKGHDLTIALKELSKLQFDLNSAVYSFLKAQMQLNNQLAMHMHPYYFGPVYPDPNLQNAVSQTMMQNHNVTFTDLKSHVTNLENWRKNYLHSAGDGYILSRYNNVN